MYEKLILLALTSFFLLINGQRNDDVSNLPMARFLTGRTSTDTFDSKFPRGRCPRRFYQIGDECLYFATDGKSYNWKQVERVCSQRISNLLEEPSASNPEQPNMKPALGVRQLTLNTPEKTDILRALFQENSEENFAIRLPDDYNSLTRCQDGQDDRWPYFCSNSQYNKSSCYETVSSNGNDICLRQVECRVRNLRVACEFTLPGSQEITTSRFRTCTPVRGRYRRLPNWAWILIIIAGGLVLLCIIAVLVGVLRRKRGNAAVSKKRTLPEPRQPPLTAEDPATRPFLIGNRQVEDPDSGYLQPGPAGNTANS